MPETRHDEPVVRVTLTTIYEKLLDVDKKVDPIPAAIIDLQRRVRMLEISDAATPPPPAPTVPVSGWKVAGVVIAGMAMLGVMLGGALQLIQALAVGG